MFSLIITLVAIVLIILLAVIAIYYGGNAWTQAQLAAQVSTLMSQGVQIKTAANAYAANAGKPVASIADLTDTTNSTTQYLTQIPQPAAAATNADGTTSSWQVNSSDASVAYIAVGKTGGNGICLCEKFNEKYGGPNASECASDTAANNIPSCTNPGALGMSTNAPVCCK